jgi:hypothetical protein
MELLLSILQPPDHSLHFLCKIVENVLPVFFTRCAHMLPGGPESIIT